MPFCPNCGSQIDGSDKFCRQCGQSLSVTSKQEKPKEKISSKGLLESRSLRYFPEDEESVHRKMTLFGWTLKTRNEVFDRTSVVDSAFTFGYSYFASTAVRSHTEVTCYISAIFERDPKTVPEYKKIAQMEKEFDEGEDKIVAYYDLLSDLSERIKHPGHDLVGMMVGLILSGSFAGILGLLAFGLQKVHTAFIALLIIAGISLLAFCILVPWYFIKRDNNKKTALGQKKKALSLLKKYEDRQKAIIKKAKSIMC